MVAIRVIITQRRKTADKSSGSVVINKNCSEFCFSRIRVSKYRAF